MYLTRILPEQDETREYSVVEFPWRTNESAVIEGTRGLGVVEYPWRANEVLFRIMDDSSRLLSFSY
jgi:hypothetical protein